MYGLGNVITPYKGREIDLDESVEVYRNLNRKGRVYSIRQNGLVVGHSTAVMLRDVKFHVGKSGVERVRKNMRKNVHAWAKGFISKRGGMGTTAKQLDEREETLPAKINYNPYTDYNFMCTNLTNKPFPVKGGLVIVFNQMGVSGAYLDTLF